MNRKFIVAFSFLALYSVAVFFLSSSALLLSIILVSLGYIKHLVYPIKKEFLWFIMISIGGAFVELALVNYAHAWSYTFPQFYGIPVYMPLFWGLLGTTIVVLYDGIVEK